jgi:hypothetical protein
MGVPANPIKLMFSTLQKASHKIHTAFGVSDKTYGHGRDPPLQGFGQGNGCGPSGWAVINVPLVNLVSKAGFGFFLLSALTVSVVQFVCFAPNFRSQLPMRYQLPCKYQIHFRGGS